MKLPKKQRDTNPSILRHFLTVLSATVFLALFLLLYNVFQWSALQTITSYNNDFVESVNTLSASLLNNIKNSAMQMFYTSSIKTLRTSQSLSNSQRILAIRDLGNFVSSSDFLDSVMIYNSSLDMIYTSEGNYAPSSPSAFYDKEAASILTHPESHPYLTPIRRQLKGNDVYSFLFFEYHNAASSSLLVNVDADWYNAHLLGLAGNSNYMVIDADGTVIAAADHSLDLFLEESWPDIRTTLAENPTEGFLMPSIFSSAPGWMYHRVVNSSWYYLRPIDLDTAVPGLMFIRNLLFTLFLIMSSILAVLAAYLLKLYLPLHSIRDAQRLNRLYEGNLPAGFAFPVLLLHTGAESAPDLKSVLKPIRTPILAALLGDRAEAAVSCCSEAERKALSDAISQIPGGRFYIGELCHSPEDIKKSRSALLELEQLHMLYPDRPVLEEALLASCNPVSSLNTRDVTALTAALQAGQIDAAQSQWNQIFSRIRNDRYWDFCFSIQYIGNQINHLIDEFQLGDHWDASQFSKPADRHPGPAHGNGIPMPADHLGRDPEKEGPLIRSCPADQRLYRTELRGPGAVPAADRRPFPDERRLLEPAVSKERRAVLKRRDPPLPRAPGLRPVGRYGRIRGIHRPEGGLQQHQILFCPIQKMDRYHA